jgi:PAS domain S-box-containing protein
MRIELVPAAMQPEAVRPDEYRVLVLPATRRDAEVTRALLEQAELSCACCDDARALTAEIEAGVGAILLTDAAFHDPHMEETLAALDRQPPWSDVPAILLCRAGAQSTAVARMMRSLRNVTILERPTTSRTLVSSVKAAIRARARQYQMRHHLDVLRKSEGAVRARERQLQTLTDNMPDILSRFDVNLRHVFVNKAATRLTGLAGHEFLGRTNRDLGMPAKLCEAWDCALRDVFISRAQRAVDFVYPSVDGPRYFHSLLIPEIGDAGIVDTVLCVGHDVTESKRASEALQQANRRKDEFLAMLAHELRNPLAPIRNASEILGRKLPADPQIQTSVAIIKRQATHLTRLVDDLLDISRITEGRIELRREPLVVSAIIAQAIESVEPLIREKNHAVLVGATYEPLYVYGDHARLVQSIANLLTNAAKYTDPGGEIRLELRKYGATIAIVISDNGVGIPEELLPRIFDLFVQGDRSLDRSQGGLGIGLSVVQRLVEMHNGRVAAFSEGAGRGSTFEIHLPLIAPPDKFADKPAGPSIQSKRILIVDDNADAANSLALLLKIEGHETEAVYSAKNALERAASRPPDVILLDIGLPDMNGYEVATRIRSTLDSVQLIALTGYGQAEDIKRARTAGFDAHVIKPVDFEVLDRIIAGFSPAEKGRI